MLGGGAGGGTEQWKGPGRASFGSNHGTGGVVGWGNTDSIAPFLLL